MVHNYYPVVFFTVVKDRRIYIINFEKKKEKKKKRKEIIDVIE